MCLLQNSETMSVPPFNSRLRDPQGFCQCTETGDKLWWLPWGPQSIWLRLIGLFWLGVAKQQGTICCPLFYPSFCSWEKDQERRDELGGNEIVCFVTLVVEKNLLGTESLGGCNGVAGVTLDNVWHCWRVLRIVSDGIHPAIGDMVSDNVLKVNEAAGLRNESHHAGTTKVVPLLLGWCMDRAELVWWHEEIVGGARIEANPTRSWLTASPGRPVILGKGNNAAHNGLVRPTRGNRIRNRWHQQYSDGVRSRCRRRHLGEYGRRTWKGLERRGSTDYFRDTISSL